MYDIALQGWGIQSLCRLLIRVCLHKRVFEKCFYWGFLSKGRIRVLEGSALIKGSLL